MNILMVLVALIFMLCVVDGANRGFIKIVASLAATIVTIVVVIMLTPYVSNVLGKIIPMETLITTNCMEVLFPERDMNKAEFKEVLPKIELNREEQISLIENSKLPEVEIVDLKMELANGNRSMLSLSLYEEIEKNLKDLLQLVDSYDVIKKLEK